MDIKKIILEELDDFQWIRDIGADSSEYLRDRIRDFAYSDEIQELGEITYDPISEEYPNIKELGRVWLGNDDGDWYWDILSDTSDGTFIVEGFTKYGNSYEEVSYNRFYSISDVLEWIFDTMIS